MKERTFLHKYIDSIQFTMTVLVFLGMIMIYQVIGFSIFLYAMIFGLISLIDFYYKDRFIINNTIFILGLILTNTLFLVSTSGIEFFTYCWLQLVTIIISIIATLKTN
jgi:hypothetical protein